MTFEHTDQFQAWILQHRAEVAQEIFELFASKISESVALVDEIKARRAQRRKARRLAA